MTPDIRKWLEDLGLGKYVETFVANDVDKDVLHDLDEGDLERLGVSLGHRKKLLRAIAELGAVPTVNSRSGRGTRESGKPLPSLAERRQLTVMFIDLVDSTALSARLDPEDMREVIGAYHRCVADTIGRFDGFVAKYMGDGVLVYFGYPRAHEDDAERAVRSGLALIEAVGRLGHSAAENLQVRIGIGTGPVIVGDLIGSGDAQERGVVGETPNLAARLQAIAEPDTVVIAASTRRLVGNLFECRDLGAVEAKGFAEPVAAWRGAARKRCRKSLRGLSFVCPDAAGRARRGDRAAAAPLGAGEERRRPSRAAVG